MCTLAFYFQVFSDYPIVIAANRDESLSRPSAPPLQLWSSPWIFGGQDLLVGGTWLGVNEHGVAAALLNRQMTQPPDPSRRSRGLLCLDVLKHRSAKEATHFVANEPLRRYNSFNLLIADSTSAFVVYAHDAIMETHALSAGTFLLTNRNLNDETCPRIARTRDRFSQLGAQLPHHDLSTAEIFKCLHLLLGTHATDSDPRHSICLHLEGYGTCSSTLLAYTAREQRYTYHFAPGSPCRTDYTEISIPYGTLASQPPSTT
jgi:uncharacterized protein with NRDE domain